MRVFVTGASGHIAAAVIPELLDAGHEVLGLARSQAAAETVQARRAQVVRGDLDDTDLLSQCAAESDGVIHLAFKHDAMFSGDHMTAIESDLAALRALGEPLRGTGKPLVGTGGTLMLAMAGISDRPGVEDDTLAGGLRADAENYVISLGAAGVRSSVIRLAPMVHSDLDHHGFTHALIQFARDSGAAAYIGDGSNRWPAANSYDIGVLYRLALEKAPAGSRFHGVEGPSMTRKQIATAIALELGLPTISVSTEEAPQYLGFLASFAALDNPISNEKTKAILGWTPTHADWLSDLSSGHYIP